MTKVDSEKFAQAFLIAQSNKKLTVQESLDLYVSALEKAKEHNSQQPLPKVNISKSPF